MVQKTVRTGVATRRAYGQAGRRRLSAPGIVHEATEAFYSFRIGPLKKERRRTMQAEARGVFAPGRAQYLSMLASSVLLCLCFWG